MVPDRVRRSARQARRSPTTALPPHPYSCDDEKTALLAQDMQMAPAERTPLLQGNMPSFAPAPFAGAILIPKDQPATQSRTSSVPDPKPPRLPQAIAHRGYKAEFPENTMDAFRAALAIGAHAIETDVHLSRDKVVVLSHDATLKRCFGLDKKIADLDWEYLSTLKTLRSPHTSMPTLVELLTFLAQPGQEEAWILLDIKRDDDPEELIQRLAETIASVPASRPWQERIMFGCWDASYMARCQTHLPGFPLAFIGWSIAYARQFLRYEGVSFNMLQQVLVGPRGSRLVRDAHARGRNVFVWTVNREEWMEWSIRKGVDGVITDDPKTFLDVCRRKMGGGEEEMTGEDGKTALVSRRRETKFWRWTRLYAEVAMIQIFAAFIMTLWRIAAGSERKRVQKALDR